MSKELELFRQIVKGYTEMFNMAIHHPKDTIVKWEGVEEIEKSLKALEIIKAIGVFGVYEDIGGRYYLETRVDEVGLTKDNYDLLKEVLL